MSLSYNRGLFASSVRISPSSTKVNLLKKEDTFRRRNMIEKLLRKFAAENFGEESNYLPVYHGRTQEIKLFELLVKKQRSFWERPLKKYKYTTLAGMEKYVKRGTEEEFQDALNEYIVKEDTELEVVCDEDEEEGASSFVEVGGEAADYASAKIKINDELGFLELGRVDQEYISDPDLRAILADTELDSNKIAAFKGQKLRLITSVIYSEHFEHKGNSFSEVEVDAGVNIPAHPLAQLKGHVKRRVVPPRIATRNTRGPFLFQCCRVVYNEETNRLELGEGEVVGKHIETHRDIGDEDEERGEYENTAIDLENEEIDWSSLANSFEEEDSKKLKIIMDSVLVPTKNREERKARVNKYLLWFEKALTQIQKKLFLDDKLSDADCEFVQSIYVPARPGQTSVDLSKLSDETIQGYAIVLKIIAGLTDEQWGEIEEAWAESGQQQE